MRRGALLNLLDFWVKDEGFLHNSYLQLANLLVLAVLRRLGSQGKNLVLDMVEVLNLNDADVLLQHALEHLLLVGLVLLACLCLASGRLVGPGLVTAHDSLEVVLEILVKLSLLVEQSGVPVVLDGVVGAAQQDVGDLGPPILNRLVKDEENPLLLDAPTLLLQQGIQLVVPSLAALLAGATGHLG